MKQSLQKKAQKYVLSVSKKMMNQAMRKMIGWSAPSLVYGLTGNVTEMGLTALKTACVRYAHWLMPMSLLNTSGLQDHYCPYSISLVHLSLPRILLLFRIPVRMQRILI